MEHQHPPRQQCAFHRFSGSASSECEKAPALHEVPVRKGTLYVRSLGANARDSWGLLLTEGDSSAGLTWECSRPLKRCLQVYSSYIRMAKLYTSEAGVTFPSLRTCRRKGQLGQHRHSQLHTCYSSVALGHTLIILLHGSRRSHLGHESTAWVQGWSAHLLWLVSNGSYGVRGDVGCIGLHDT